MLLEYMPIFCAPSLSCVIGGFLARTSEGETILWVTLCFAVTKPRKVQLRANAEQIAVLWLIVIVLSRRQAICKRKRKDNGAKVCFISRSFDLFSFFVDKKVK